MNDMVFWANEEAYQRYTNSYITPVTEITAERYNDMLEILPPVGWHIGQFSESFKMMEMICGNITGIFAKYGNRYFELSDRVTLQHHEIIERVNAFVNAKDITA